MVLDHRAAARSTVAMAPAAHSHGARARRSDIAVISDGEDAHITMVQAHLDGELIVVDPVRGALTFERGGCRGATLADRRCLNDVGVVWYRKPLTRVRPLVELHVAPEDRRYSRSAITLHAELLHSSLRHASWVSDPLAIGRAEAKALQLEIARSSG